MGNDISGGSYQELEGLKKYAGFSPGQVEMIREKFDIMSDEDLTLSKDAFKKLMKVNDKEVERVFEYFDIDQSNRIDSYEFICGIALLSQTDLKGKSELIFNLYDFDKNRTITQNELVILIKTTMTSLNAMAQKAEATIQEAEQKQKEILDKYDTNKDGTISLREFQSFISKDPDILKMLYSYGLISKEDLRPDFGTGTDEMPECDSDLENEINKGNEERDERVERITNGIEHNEIYEDDKDDHNKNKLSEEEEEELQTPWKKTIKNLVPTQYKKSNGESNQPAASLDIDYIHGYRSFDTRNNIRYTPSGELIYHTAAIGIILDTATSSQSYSQKYYQEHNDDIVCLDSFENKVVTGQLGLNPMICIWDVTNQNSLIVFKGVLKNGIGNVCFSNDGKKIAACALDEEHTIAVYDVDKAIASRKNPSKKNTEDGLISTGKLTRTPVFDLRFELNDKTVIAGGLKEILFITFEGGVLKKLKGVWDKNSIPQSVLTVGFVETNTVSGMFSGQLLVWNKNKLKQSIQAHQGPVTAMLTRKGQQKGLITAGRDGVILYWDHSIKQSLKIDTKEFRFFSNRIISLAEYYSADSANSKLAIGSRSGEIAERVHEKPKIVVKGHYDGELWGLAVHTKNNQFFTVGEDNLLACWDIKKRMMLLGVKLDFPAKALHMSPNGKYLTVGCTNGSVLIIDPKSLVVTFTFKDRDKDVSCIKFSPDSDRLAVAYGSPSCEILIYSVRQHFKNEAKLRGSTSRVTHIDFSNDGNNIMCNNSRFEILFFDLNQQKLNNKFDQLRDETWFTMTCILGWQVQGIWPPCSQGLDINSCDRTLGNNGDVLVTADDFSKIKLFKYPSAQPNASFAKYSGHSAQITNVRFSCDSDYIVSTGGNEKSIIVWKYNFDRAGQEESDEINKIQVEEQDDMQEEDNDAPDPNTSNKPYLGQVTNSGPSWYKPNVEKDNRVPDYNLTLSHVHGFRSFYNKDECRGMCKYLNNQKVVFGAAALGVVQDPKNKGHQTFFQKHKEDVVSLAIHPKGNIVATGQMALGGNSKVIDIFIWDAETKAVLGHINDFHRKAVVWLEFSPDGSLLFTAGQDEDNSIAIYDWQSSRIIATSKVDKSKVNCAAWKTNNDFVTVGNRHVKFWSLQGRNIKSENGTFGGKKFEAQTTVCYAFNGEICVTGGVQGNIYTWNEHQANQPPIPAHSGKIGALMSAKNNTVLLSGGYDGKVITWTLTSQNGLTQQQDVVDISSNKIAPMKIYDHSIVSLDIKNDMLLIGTKGSEILEIKQHGQSKPLIIQQGHYTGDLWGLAVAPTRSQFVTCGGDKMIRKWDIENNELLQTSNPFEYEIRSIDWSKDGQFLTVGDMKGFVYLVQAEDLKTLDKADTKFSKQSKAKKNANYWIGDVKISPDCTKVAFGAHNTQSTIEVWEIAGGKKFSTDKNISINAGLGSSLIHLDWSDDNACLVVNSSSYELKYVSVAAKGKDISAGASRDFEWNTWTCIYGWYTYGIFPKTDGLGVQSCTRSSIQQKDVAKDSPNYQVICTGDVYGRLNLYQYPVITNKQVYKTYLGHSSAVTRTRFTHDDRHLVSIGGQDKTVLVWETDLQQAKEQDEYDEEAMQEEGSEIQQLQPKKWKKGADKYGKGNKLAKQQAANADGEDYFAEEAPERGDEFMAVKPWEGAIKEPSYYYKDPLNQNKKPPISLNIDYVFGYRAKNTKNNIRYLKHGGIVYHAASLGIICDTTQQIPTQRYFAEHDDDITCLDLHPDGVKVATGQIGPKATIYVWDTNTLHAICTFKGHLTKGISTLAFTPSGDKLAAVAIDNYHEIAIFDITAKSVTGGVIITKTKCGPEFIMEVKWRNENEFASVGIKHMKVWTLSNTNLKARKGIWGKNKCSNRLLTLAANAENYIAGGQDGTVQIFNQNNLQSYKKHHDRAIDCIIAVNSYILIGGRDSKVTILDKNYNFLLKITDDQFKGSFSSEIKAIHLTSDNKNIVIGTSGSEIYEFSTKDAKLTTSTRYSGQKKIMSGHFAPNKQTENELWGLTSSLHDKDLIASCSDDGTLRTWSIQNKRMIKYGKTNQDEKGQELGLDHRTNDLQDNCKGRALAISNDGEAVVVGFKDGAVKIYDKDLNFKSYHKFAKECISDIKFSPSGDMLAVGSHDNAIYIYLYNQDMKQKCKPLRKHSSYITHFDFSIDGNYLHSNCGAYELLYWDVSAEKAGKQITSGATQFRDEKWNSLSTPLSWGTQGIWPEYADGTDINTTDRSNQTYSGQDGPPDNYHLLATGDDKATVKVFRYPCVKKGSQFVEGKGHSSHITNIKFSYEDEYIFSSGGEDNCIILWKVTKNK